MDGFTVLPNGNFLINEGDDDNTYDQYNPTTGAVIPGTTFTSPGASFGTGVDTDGTSLFFHTNTAGFVTDFLVQTDLTGTLTGGPVTVGPDTCEDISLDDSVCLGVAGATPGKPDCHGKCVSFLAKTDGGLDTAASDFG